MKKGFTLVELVIGVGIIALLTSIGLAYYGSVNKRARDGKRKADIEVIRSALEMYKADNSSYPPDGATFPGSIVSYINPYPADPGTTSYTYSRPTTTTYSLCATYEIPDAVCGNPCCKTQP